MERETLLAKQRRMQVPIKELAHECGVCRETMSRALSGKRACKPSLAKAERYLARRRWQCEKCGHITEEKGYCPKCDSYTWKKCYVEE